MVPLGLSELIPPSAKKSHEPFCCNTVCVQCLKYELEYQSTKAIPLLDLMSEQALGCLL